MKKNIKKALVFITCAVVGGAAIFANPAKDRYVEQKAEYYPLLDVTVIETKDAHGKTNIEFKEGNHEYLNSNAEVKEKHERKDDVQPLGFNPPVQKPDVEQKKHEAKPHVEIHIDFPDFVYDGSKTEHHRSEPQAKHPEHHRSEPQTKRPEHHRSEPQVKRPEHHRSEPRSGSQKGPAAVRITGENDR